MCNSDTHVLSACGNTIRDKIRNKDIFIEVSVASIEEKCNKTVSIV